MQTERNAERAVTDEQGNVKIIRSVIEPLSEEQTADVLAAMERFDKSFDRTSKNILLYDIYLMDDSDVILTESLTEDIPVFLSYPAAVEGEIYSDYRLFWVKEDGTVEETETDEEGLTFALRERGRYVLLWQSALQEKPRVSATDAVSGGRNRQPLLYAIGGALGAALLAVVLVVTGKRKRSKSEQPAREKEPSQEAADSRETAVEEVKVEEAASDEKADAAE